VCQTISRDELEGCYGILLPQPTEDEDATRCPTAYELLTAYASNDCYYYFDYITIDYCKYEVHTLLAVVCLNFGSIVYCHC